ncbi:MAG: AAA family ATPase [Sphingomonas sp.]|nr:MAG: AAA family ATPase [Sphingomonas sp.]
MYSTRERLVSLRLPGMVKAFDQQLGSSAFSAMPFEERLDHLASMEEHERDHRTRQRLLRQAKFKVMADPREINFDAQRGLDRAYLAELLTCGWIRRCDNLLISGAAGTGKSFLGSAFGMAAIDLGLSVRYVRTNLMLEQMALAHNDGSIAKLRHQLISPAVLIIDDFGIAPINIRAKEDLLELLDGRIDAGSTIVIGQLAPEEWHDYLDAPHLADAIIDRLFQRSHRFALKGASMRMRL